MKERIGLYIGRFQPFHKGHEKVVRTALAQCDKLIIAVGSSQACRTKKNPFSYGERRIIIRRSLGRDNRVIIVPIPDRPEYSDDGSWGQYVLDCVEKECGLRPTINFEGEELCRSTWFDGIDIERVVISRREVPISATEVRQAIVEDRYSDFCQMVSRGLWLGYYMLRRVLLEVKENE